MLRFRFLILAVLASLALTAPAAAQQDQVVYATAQRFEHGLMIWRSDTGHIWAVADNGLAFSFPTTSYSHLPDNPIFGTPPSRLRPILGFGKVWGYYNTVRQDLGWPTLPEIGFDMPVHELGGTIYLTQLDQSVIKISPDLTWTRIENPVPPQPIIDEFTATPSIAAQGGWVTLTWRVRGTEAALIEVYDRDNPQIALNVIENLPLIGTKTIRLPASVATGARIVLWGVNRSRNPVLVTMWEHVVQSELVVELEQPSGNVTQTQAAFQQYEHGFMIWRADTGAVMVFGSGSGSPVLSFSESRYAPWPDLPVDYDIPADRVRPVNAFGRVWVNVQQVRDLLGFATGQEQGYTMTVRSIDASTSDLSLPDGRIARIAAGSYTWQYLADHRLIWDNAIRCYNEVRVTRMYVWSCERNT